MTSLYEVLLRKSKTLLNVTVFNEQSPSDLKGFFMPHCTLHCHSTSKLNSDPANVLRQIYWASLSTEDGPEEVRR